MARKVSGEAELTRQAIIQAAARVFCQTGISSATLEAVAREAGVTRGAIYWHFGGKPGLLNALFEEQSMPLDRPLPPDITFSQGWESLSAALEETLQNDMFRQLSKIMLHKSERVADSPVAERLMQIRGSFVKRLRLLLQCAIERGELHPQLDTGLVGDVFQSCITGLLFDCLQETGGQQLQIAGMLDTLRYLLLEPPEHFLLKQTGK